MEVSQLVSIAGAAMVLGAFAALQLKRAQPFGRIYLTLNVVGSGCLAVAAGLEALWAFVTLNTVWGLVSVRSLVLVVLGKGPAVPPATLADRDASFGVHDIPG